MGLKQLIKEGFFDGTVETLKQYKCPEWFRNAKFGIWSHWGPQSVPMYGDWYARNMYLEGSDQYLFHFRKYGHPSQFGYKDIISLWKAENFNPEELMELYVRAGAKYFVAQAMHHDNFDNFDSEFNPWNSTKIGPKKDICMMWKKAAKKYNLPFGVTEHLAASYTWLTASHGCDKEGAYKGIPYDGANKEFESLYRDNDSELFSFNPKAENWYTKNEKYHKDWFNRIKDAIDKLQPDLLYSDGELPFEDYGLAIVAHLYNSSMERNNGKNEAVYNFKQHDITNVTEHVTEIGVLDIERGISDDISEKSWQDDTSIGDWFYNVRDRYKTTADILDTLIDVVSKNGNLLMNVTQRPDGSIDDETRYTLESIAVWMKDNAQGIFNTRPFEKAGEGVHKLSAGAFQENSATWDSKDFRFTRSGSQIFAFQMRNDDGKQARITSLGRLYLKTVISVMVLGQEVCYSQKDGALLVEMPSNPHKGLPICITVQLED